MDDERLADLLEELPEDEQLRLVEGLDLDRLIGVLDEMEYDDLADLLGEMPGEQRDASSRRWTTRTPTSSAGCLSYEAATAGGMMTPELIILGPTTTVAEALAQIRQPDWVVSIAAQVFVCHPPFKAPTGKFLGTAHFQRLLREPPSMELRHCVSNDPVVGPDATDRAVAELLASYDMLAVAVCDAAGRLLGAVTVDDVLDRQLGAGWRSSEPRDGPDENGVNDGEAPRGPQRPAASRGSASATTPRRSAGSPSRSPATSARRASSSGRRSSSSSGSPTTCSPRRLAVRPVGPRPRAAHPRAVAAGVVRRAADPARPEPPGAPRPRAVGERPQGRRTHAGRHRVPRPRDRRRAPDARRRTGGLVGVAPPGPTPARCLPGSVSGGPPPPPLSLPNDGRQLDRFVGKV